MSEDEDQDLPDVCAVCSKKLSALSRSETQSDLCKVCAGEEDDLEALDDFK